MKKTIVYTSSYCPYCMKVANFIKRNEIDVEYRNVWQDWITAELIERWWDSQVPYLVDEKQGIEMYESDDIITHLKKYYL